MFKMELIRAGRMDENRIQNILDGAPKYHLNTEGMHPISNAGRDTLESCPPDFNFNQKHVLIIRLNNEDIGVADILENFPKNKMAFLGLFLLKESFQGVGLGKLIYAEVQNYLFNLNCYHIRIAVVDSNPVEPFWEKMGFQRTGKTAPHQGAQLQSIKRVLEKGIASP